MNPRIAHKTADIGLALERLENGFLHSDEPDALLARREAGRPRPEDSRRAQEMVAKIRADQQRDGAWGGGLIPTAETLMRLAELLSSGASPASDSTVTRAMTWLRQRRGSPGRYGEGCTPERHRLGFCEHFLGGFFAPTPPVDSPGQAFTIDCGASFGAGPAGALVASCRALRARLAWGFQSHDDRAHFDGLRRILMAEPYSNEEIAPIDALPELLLTLLEAPRTEPNMYAIRHGLERLVPTQRADGSWPELEIFHVLEALLAAADLGYDVEGLGAAIRRSAGLLAVSQHDDGSWERNPLPRRSRIGWRALKHAAANMENAPVRALA